MKTGKRTLQSSLSSSPNSVMDPPGTGYMTRYIREIQGSRSHIHCFFTEDFSGFCFRYYNPTTSALNYEHHYQNNQLNDIDGIAAARWWYNKELYCEEHYNNGVLASSSRRQTV
jgi:hypothetical protein